jgi:hypothetical protein
MKFIFVAAIAVAVMGASESEQVDEEDSIFNDITDEERLQLISQYQNSLLNEANDEVKFAGFFEK